jgi:alpha-galactosidase
MDLGRLAGRDTHIGSAKQAGPTIRYLKGKVMIKRVSTVAMFALFAGLFISASLRAEELVPLGALDLKKMKQGWGEAKIDRSVTDKPLSIGGKTFEHGVGTHAQSVFYVQLDGGTSRFSAQVGVDDSQAGTPASVEFRVYADGKKLFASGPMKPGDAAIKVDVDLRGAKLLLLFVGAASDGISFDHANWADAQFTVTGEKPKATDPPREEAVRLTPKTSPKPRINGPDIYGCRPGNPFLYRIPTTGERPMTFGAENLPEGLKLDAKTGIITGVNPPRGNYVVTLRAENSLGKAEKKFEIASGDTLALTPPMGWNHWYAHYARVVDRTLREAAEGMVENGMADVGYQFVSIDDCWMNAPENSDYDASRRGPLRDERGNIIPNKNFPNMKAMTDFIHSFGLKAGIYTSPGPLTCAGFAGAYQHEAQDAKQFADWGFDMLKYDWCSYGSVAKDDRSLDALQKPYILMGKLLREQKRDIELNLCQYGMGNVWEWGEKVGGHSWRTAGDLGFELDRIIDIAVANAAHREWSKPGAWNDPDYLQIGFIGSAMTGGEPQPCPLTPNEQYSFMSLWCLMASPLFYSGDVPKLDDFSLGILCNAEAIEVNQDRLGQCARTVILGDDAVLFVKDMADGSKAVGLCNRGEMEIEIAAKWQDLGVKGPQRVRDLWRQKDLGEFDGSFTAKVGRHGTFLIRLWPAAK